jgi:hypothetical protein
MIRIGFASGMITCTENCQVDHRFLLVKQVVIELVNLLTDMGL